MSGDLVEFLLARITEDEAVAGSATPGPWRVDSEDYAEAIYGPDGMDVASGGKWGGEAAIFDTEDALHIARWNPARVLAECEAKRRIIEGARGDRRWTPDGVTAGPCPVTYFEPGRDEWLLRLLALPYADHPGYRDEWRPA